MSLLWQLSLYMWKNNPCSLSGGGGVSAGGAGIVSGGMISGGGGGVGVEGIVSTGGGEGGGVEGIVSTGAGGVGIVSVGITGSVISILIGGKEVAPDVDPDKESGMDKRLLSLEAFITIP